MAEDEASSRVAERSPFQRSAASDPSHGGGPTYPTATTPYSLLWYLYYCRVVRSLLSWRVTLMWISVGLDQQVLSSRI